MSKLVNLALFIAVVAGCNLIGVNYIEAADVVSTVVIYSFGLGACYSLGIRLGKED